MDMTRPACEPAPAFPLCGTIGNSAAPTSARLGGGNGEAGIRPGRGGFPLALKGAPDVGQHVL